ncbi:MAG: tellurite resistance TerB family protein [Rhodobacteraceae bacterium]|nr:tellurite resistance TerB family protein [Paracoccaceae bacterium]
MPNSLPPSFSPQDALVAVMIAESASDEDITNSELLSITRIVDHMPIFADYDSSRIKQVAQTVFDLFEIEDGLDALFGIVREALPETLYETAYAMACDIAAADGRLKQSELEFMAEIRYELNIDRLHGAAIERGARARHMQIPKPA